jgi:hypothetical protein
MRSCAGGAIHGSLVESSVDALQRFEAECGWSEAPRLLAEVLSAAGGADDEPGRGIE